MFRSRRSATPPPETAKVAEVVKAYYDAGRRPASHLAPPPEPRYIEVPDEAPDASPEPEAGFEPESAPVAVTAYAESPLPDTPDEDAAVSEPARHPAPVHKTLAELAVELEAFIEVIRYGDDLGSSTGRN
jgi:hypothetical protein